VANKKKPKIKAYITEAALALREIMQRNLSAIAGNMIERIRRNLSNSTDATRINAIKGVDPVGIADYKAELLTALSVITFDAIQNAKKEIPGMKNIKFCEHGKMLRLAEFDKLNGKLQNFVKSQNGLVIETQIGDLEKAIFFQFTHSYDTTDDIALIAADLEGAAEEYITGNAIGAGSSILASKAVNTARDEFFTQEEIQDQVDCFQFINADPVTEICQDLNGTYFDLSDPENRRYVPPLHWNAVLENTMITGKSGEKKIQDIIIGDFVLTHKNQYKKVSEIMSKIEDKEYFEIVLENGKSMNITGEHPVLTKDADWVRVDELTLNDDIICFEDIND